MNTGRRTLRAGRWFPAVSRALGATATAVAALAVVLASGTFGARIPDVVALDDIPRIGGAGAGPVDALAVGGVAALRREFLEHVLGEDAVALLGAPFGGAPNDEVRSPDAAPAPTAGPAGTTTTTTATGPRGGDGLVPTLPTDADLVVAMVADRDAVKPGERIVYSMIVTNIGGERFVGEIHLESHHPFGTTDATCDVTDEGDVCVPVPVPGVPNGDVHTVNMGRAGPIEPGERVVFRFAARVNETTQPGAELTNHAHLIVTGSDDPPETSNVVVVRVVA